VLVLLRALSVLHFGHKQRELEGVAVAVEFVTEPVDLMRTRCCFTTALLLRYYCLLLCYCFTTGVAVEFVTEPVDLRLGITEP
jgi:hypothetical protein